ncbi:MAG: 30S ribosomal protein S16 [Ilumatobacter sp.]
MLGQYNPREEPSLINVDNDKIVKWLSEGAQPTERVAKIIKISGAQEQFEAAKAASK